MSGQGDQSIQGPSGYARSLGLILSDGKSLKEVKNAGRHLIYALQILDTLCSMPWGDQLGGYVVV